MAAHLESIRGAFTLAVRCGFKNTTCGMRHLFVWLSHRDLWHTHLRIQQNACQHQWYTRRKPLTRGLNKCKCKWQINDKHWITCYHRQTHENNSFRLSRMRPREGGVEALISPAGNSQSLIWLMYTRQQSVYNISTPKMPINLGILFPTRAFFPTGSYSSATGHQRV